VNERKAHTKLKGGLISEPPKIILIRPTLPSRFSGQSNTYLPKMESHSPSSM
jgi:hypothetical protein